MDQATFANAVLWELRFIHWLLIALLIALGCVALFLLGGFRAIVQYLSAVGRQQEQSQFQQRLEDLLTKGIAKDALFVATEAIASRPRDPYVYWYLGQAN